MVKEIIKRIRNKVVMFFYRIITGSLDKEGSLFLRNISRKAGYKEYQQIFSNFWMAGLTGMNYGNSDPENNGEYAILERLLTKSLISKDVVIFDVGSNIGDYAKKVKNYSKDAVIHCFEPSVNNFNELRKRTSYLNNIIYNNFGLGESSKEATLYKNSQVSDLASVYKRDLGHLGIKMDITETIKITTLDDYCQLNNIDNIDFLKLDVEGNELNVFIGARRMISEKRIRFMQFEIGGCNIHSKVFWQEIFQLLNSNYTLSRIVKDGIVEFGNYSEFNEIFVYANYFAEIRS